MEKRKKTLFMTAWEERGRAFGAESKKAGGKPRGGRDLGGRLRPRYREKGKKKGKGEIAKTTPVEKRKNLRPSSGRSLRVGKKDRGRDVMAASPSQGRVRGKRAATTSDPEETGPGRKKDLYL